MPEYLYIIGKQRSILQVYDIEKRINYSIYYYILCLLYYIYTLVTSVPLYTSISKNKLLLLLVLLFFNDIAARALWAYTIMYSYVPGWSRGDNEFSRILYFICGDTAQRKSRSAHIHFKP